MMSNRILALACVVLIGCSKGSETSTEQVDQHIKLFEARCDGRANVQFRASALFSNDDPNEPHRASLRRADGSAWDEVARFPPNCDVRIVPDTSRSQYRLFLPEKT